MHCNANTLCYLYYEGLLNMPEAGSFAFKLPVPFLGSFCCAFVTMSYRYREKNIANVLNKHFEPIL